MKLDELLWELEDLAEVEATAIPHELADRLAAAGVRGPTLHSIPQLHEIVLDLQRPFTGYVPSGPLSPRATVGLADKGRRHQHQKGELVSGFRLV